MCRELTPHGNVGGKVEYRGKQYSVILSIGGKWKWSAEIDGHTRSGSHRPACGAGTISPSGMASRQPSRGGFRTRTRPGLWYGPHMRSAIWIGIFIGSTIGGFIPVIWGDDMLSYSGVLFSGIGAFVGLWFGSRAA